MPKKQDLYGRVIEITGDYLGPAAPRFIDRQIQSHLNKKPHDLEKRDLSKLIEWLRISFSHLTSDQILVEEYAKRLRFLKSRGL